MAQEERLITDLVTRISLQLPSWRKGAKTQEELAEDLLREQNETYLCSVSAFKLHVVAQGLCNVIEKYMKMSHPTDDAALNGAHSLVYLLKLLSSCLQFQWNHIKGQINHLEGIDEKEKIRLKQTEEGILPPSLEDGVAVQMFRQVMSLLTRQHPHMHAEIHRHAAEVLFQLSASNYDTIIGSINMIFTNVTGGSEEETIAQLLLVEHINLNMKRLSELVDKVNRSTAHFKKAGVQFAVARVLRKAIWNWIDHYPMEFVSLCQKGVRLPGNPDTLFDTFDSWAGSSNSKRKEFWPVMTMLLILCPDIMLETVQEKADGHKSKSKFLENLKKSLKSNKLADVSAICYVDIFKASTFVSKSDMSALRHIVPAIETELKERLFNPNNPFKRSDGTVDEDLMVNCLVSAFMLSARKVINSLFADCLSKSTPKLFKQVLVRCLLIIAEGGANLPWNPTISDIYSAHASNLRSLFQECIGSITKYAEVLPLADKDKKARAQLDSLKLDIDILRVLLTLYYKDPLLALYPLKTATQDIEDIRKFMTGLVVASTTLPLTDTVTVEASKALLELHRPENIMRWCPRSILDGFWTISSAVNVAFSEVLITQKELTVVTIQTYVSSVHKILECRNEFLQTANLTVSPDSHLDALRSSASSKLEIALLVHLCSGKPEIGSVCAAAFGLLCNEVDLMGEVDEGKNGIVANYSAYKTLSTTGVLSTGRQAQQKAVRSTLRKVERQTLGNYTAWQEVYQRFQQYTVVVLSESASTGMPADKTDKKKLVGKVPQYLLDKNPTEVFLEWNNQLGFLAALSGVALNEEIWVTKQVAGAKGKMSEEKVSVLDEFLAMALNLLVSDLVKVRESVKIALGTAVAPVTYPTFLKLLHEEAKKTFGTAGQVNFSNEAVLLFDQAISILKLIFDTEMTGQDFSLLSDIDLLINTLLKFVRQLQFSVTTLQTKHRLCTLLDSVMARRAKISFRNEFEFRSELVNSIMEWTSEFSGQVEVPDDGSKKQVEKLVKELDLQVMNTLSSLLRGLPLQGEDDQTKSAAFSKLFTFFTRLLTRCKKDPTSVLQPQVPEATITCVSSLVTANIEHGLEYFVTMGYHEDHETRSAFLRVLCNILNQGTEFDLGDDSADRYYKLLELMMEGDMGLVLALGDAVQITEADKVAQLLVRIFEANDKTLELVRAAINGEVSKTETANTLFRRNSMVTKMLAAYCKLCGREYLREALGPQVRYVIQNPTKGWEMDESKLPEGQQLSENIANVTAVCEALLGDIRASIPRCPRPFRDVSSYLRSAVGEKFPGNEYTAIAGFMFLRFLGPAIVAPDGYGVINTSLTDKDARRAFVLITKVVQNLANRVHFTKEPFMACMNSFIDDHLADIQSMFDSYSTVPDDAPPSTAITFTDEQKDEDLGQLHWLLVGHLEKMSRAINASQDPKLTEMLGRLTNILAQLGPPPEPSKTTTVAFSRASGKDGANVAFEKFMKRMADRNTAQMKDLNIFFQRGTLADKTPVFYYVARKFAQNLDSELLIYYMLKTAQPYLQKKWCLVVDLSLFGQEHEVPYAWCNQLHKVIPPVAGENLESIFVLHANSWVKKYSKRLSKLTTRVNKKMEFFSSISALADRVPELDKGLPSSTLNIEKNIQATFAPVTKITKYGKKPCTVNIGTDMLHVISSQSHLLFNQNAQMVDLVHISRITSIERKGVDEQDCVVAYEWSGSRTLEFRGPSCGQIIQQLTASKDRYNLSRPQNTLSGSRAFSPADVPGTLLNMSLLNITAANPTLRSAAYNLLVSLCNSFGYGLRDCLLECTDVTIPRNARHFVVKVSRELSINEPKLTLEFLLESLHGITKTNNLGQHLVLDYVNPWLPNLVFYSRPTRDPDSKDKLAKTKEVLNSLIALTIREANDMGPAIMTRIWKPIGRIPEMADIVLQCLVERAIPATSKTSAIGTKNMMTAEDIIVCLGTENRQYYAGKLVGNILRLLEETREKPADVLSEHELWIHIEIHVRWLMMLSFDNLLAVENYLPEYFHILTLVFYQGTTLLRATVHRLFINIVHSIHTHALCDPSKAQQLRFHLAEFQQLPFRLHMGLSGTDAGPFGKGGAKEKVDKMPISMVESVVDSFIAALNCCYPTPTCIGQSRHSRWLGLTIQQAFTTNPALQPRAMVALGKLCQSPELVTDELVALLLTRLRESLHGSMNSSIDDLSVSIIMCLANIFEHLRPTSKFFRRFFWIVMSLLQIHDVKLFQPSLMLMEAVLRALDENDCLRGYGLSAFCMESREGSFAPLLSKLDQVTGVSFKQQFSFAVAGHLLKGFRHANTKTPTTRLLSTILDVCRENVGANMLGYCTALLPYKSEDVHQRLNASLESAAEGPQQVLFNSQMVPDKMNAALLFTFLATVLKTSDFEHEQLFIFQTFQEGVNFLPDAFAVTFDTLVPKMTHMLLNSQSPEMLSAVLSILKSIFYYALDSSSATSKLTAAYLPTIGFAGLAQSDQFNEGSATKQTVIKIVCSIIDSILE
eukprot:TRINITY_DN1591_c0_g1_i1.p1 TRINITY_DN1591_c0_g1~~TRINITY_DN1591_c0_g1_i1.p1  ORF type:complete len:2499 (-),score=1256.67 TRINITY_DN1591_c0_g1_i1:167-7663(-)